MIECAMCSTCVHYNRRLRPVITFRHGRPPGIKEPAGMRLEPAGDKGLCKREPASWIKKADDYCDQWKPMEPEKKKRRIGF